MVALRRRQVTNTETPAAVDSHGGADGSAPSVGATREAGIAHDHPQSQPSPPIESPPAAAPSAPEPIAEMNALLKRVADLEAAEKMQPEMHQAQIAANMQMQQEAHPGRVFRSRS
jgi:hypothetical protein